MSDFNAAEYSDIFHQAKVNFDERSELVQVVSKAIGRRMDQLIIDAVNAASGTGTVAKTVVTSGSAAASNLNVGKLIAAKKAMDAKNVPFDDRHIIIHANSLSGLLASPPIGPEGPIGEVLFSSIGYPPELLLPSLFVLYVAIIDYLVYILNYSFYFSIILF